MIRSVANRSCMKGSGCVAWMENMPGKWNGVFKCLEVLEHEDIALGTPGGFLAGNREAF